MYMLADISRPKIHNCPEDAQIITTKKGTERVTVTWKTILATDNSGIEPTVYESMKSGVTLGEGEYTVNVFAIDHAGLFAGCEFTVFIIGEYFMRSI